MTPETWLPARVELLPGYPVTGPDGAPTTTVEADIAITGGFVHLRVPDTKSIQVVSAPALLRLTYTPQPDDAKD